MNHQVVTDYTNVNTENSSVCVFVRARPPDQGWTLEDDDSVEDKFQNPLQATLAGLSPTSASAGLSPTPQATSSAFIMNFPDNPKKICIRDPSAQSKHHGEIYFSFDRVFWTECCQEEIFQAVAKPQVENIMNGFNGCCFAYGQTGSGKTYSMFGEGEGNTRGMIPRCMEEIFSQLEKRAKDKELAVVVSFLEIYCDQVRDLGEAYMPHGESTVDRLKTTSDIYTHMMSTRAESFQRRSKTGSRGGGGAPGLSGSVWDSYSSMDLKIHEDVQGNVFVKDLSLIPVTTLEEVLEIISLGLKLRATHETKMNRVSSRSHTVFTVTVVQRDPFTEDTITGMLNLVDLAGSERLKKSASEGQRKTEALHINSSLTALGKVVMALDPTSGLSHVSYRDSKLTRLLQNSLGGNSFTVVLATLNPVSRFSEECLSTLQFANRCRSVHNNPRVNKLDTAAVGDSRKLKKLQDEIQALRMRLGTGGGVGFMGGAGGMGVDPNARVMAVLAQMGITGASQLADGSIRLPDVRIVGQFGLGGDDDAGGAEGSSGGRGSERARFGLGARGKLKWLPADVQMMVEELQTEVRGGRKKLQERKKELAALNSQLQAGRAASAEKERISKGREAEIAGRLAIAQARLCKVGEEAARTKGEQLAAVLAESQVLLRRQRRQLMKAAGWASASAVGCQGKHREKRGSEARARQDEKDKHTESMRSLEFSKEVEAEHLRQRCRQLVELEARGRETAEAKLERYKRNKAREVFELSMELLFLHDHALAVANNTPPHENGGMTSAKSRNLLPVSDATDNSGFVPHHHKSFRHSNDPPSPLLQHLPRLMKLISARQEDPERLLHSLSEPGVVTNNTRSGGGGGFGTSSTPKAATTRPMSAGAVAVRTSTSTSWKRLHSASAARIPALSASERPAPTTGSCGAFQGSTGHEQGHDQHENHLNNRKGATNRGLRPRSAPGRRPTGSEGNKRGRCRSDVSVDQEEDCGCTEWGKRQEIGARAGIGWKHHDEVRRDVGELSRVELIHLVERLREKIGRAKERDDQRECEKKIASRQQRQQRQNTAGSDVHDTRGTEPDSESGRDVRACQENPTDAQALLREQVRRYNDLRIAYQSLTRRLETGGCSNGARRSGPDKGSSACLRQIKPESHGRRGVGTSGAPRAAGGDAPQTRSGKRPCCTGARSPRALGIRSERLG